MQQTRTVFAPFLRTMPAIRVYLFQTLRITWDETLLTELGSPTTRSLLSYLLMHRQSPTDRRRLAFLFWPRGTESAARRNLRQYLHHIRRVLEPIPFDGDLLLADGSSVHFNPQAKLWLDVETFRENALPTASLAQLQTAAALYTGDLLEDLYENWTHEPRGQFRRLYLDVLKRLSNQLPLVGASGQAINYARQWVQADPLDEAAHQALMRLYVQQGQRNHAIRHYQHLVQMLQDELGVEPLPETKNLARALHGDESPPSTALPAAATAPAPDVFAALPLVGRDEYLAQMETVHRIGENWQGKLVLISGEPGIGKTRLVQEYLQKHPGVLVLQSICHELKTLIPYAALHQIFAKLLQTVPAEILGDVEVWQNALDTLSPRTGTHTPRGYRQSSQSVSPERFGNLILQLCRSLPRRPLYLVFDDFHWCDTSTWQVLDYLALHIAEHPLVVIGLCRPEDVPAERRLTMRTWERYHLLKRLHLRRLTQKEVQELVAQWPAHRGLDDRSARRLYQETEGNPLFIVEMLRAMQESGQPYKSLAFRTQIPLSIQRIIEARLDHLSDENRELLAQAAVIGREFSFTLLQIVSRRSAEQLIPHIETWLQRDLVREVPAGYDFSHDKIRQVAQAQLSQARRQYIHRCIAEALEETVPPADSVTLAHHYAHSDQPLKAIPYLTRAGEQALQMRSYHEARQFGLHAMRLLGRMPGPSHKKERLELNLQLAQVYAFAGNIAQARKILLESEHLAFAVDDKSLLMRLHRRLAQIYWLDGQPEEAADYARRSLRLASEQNSHHHKLAALRMLGRTGIAQSAFDDAIAALQQYIRIQAERGGQASDLSVVYGYLGVAYSRVGNWQQALESVRQGVALAETHGTLQNLHFALMQDVFVHAHLRDWASCRQTLDRISFSTTDDSEITPLTFMILSLQGYVSAVHPPRENGIAQLKRALGWAEANNHRIFHYLPRIFLARTLLRDGRLKDAEREARRALDQARAGNDRWAKAVALQLMGEIYAQNNAPEWPQVEQYLIESMQILRRIRARPDLARTYLVLRKLYDRAGQVAWAVDCHFRATTIFEELGMLAELRQAQGQPGGTGHGLPPIPDSGLRGPNAPQPANRPQQS